MLSWPAPVSPARWLPFAFVLALTPIQANANEETENGLQAYAALSSSAWVPMTGERLKEEVVFYFPFAAEAGARYEAFTLGAFVQHGQITHNCSQRYRGRYRLVTTDCDAGEILEYGLQAGYRFKEKNPTKLIPWVGVGLGYQRYRSILSGLAVIVVPKEGYYYGFHSSEWQRGMTLRLNFGLDFESKYVGFGPMFGLAIGDYYDGSIFLGPEETIDAPVGFHSWATLGLRVTGYY